LRNASGGGGIMDQGMTGQAEAGAQQGGQKNQQCQAFTHVTPMPHVLVARDFDEL
jgi:hypothetical protein